MRPVIELDATHDLYPLGCRWACNVNVTTIFAPTQSGADRAGERYAENQSRGYWSGKKDFNIKPGKGCPAND